MKNKPLAAFLLLLPGLALADAPKAVVDACDSALRLSTSNTTIADYQRMDVDKRKGAVDDGNKCLNAIAAAKLADADIINRVDMMGGVHPYPAKDVKKVCNTVVDLAGRAFWSGQFNQGCVYFIAPYSDDNVLDNIHNMMDGCKKVMADATAAKVPGDYVVITDDTGDITFASMNEKFFKRLDDHVAPLLAKQKAAEAAKWGPYEAVLADDKLATFNLTYKVGMNVWGPKKKSLEKPADFKAAPTWYTVGVNREGIVPRWDVSGTKFKGNKKIGDAKSKSGNGETPPASAFP